MIDLTVDAVRAEKGMMIPWFIVTAFVAVTAIARPGPRQDTGPVSLPMPKEFSAVASEPVIPPLIPWNGQSHALM